MSEQRYLFLNNVRVKTLPKNFYYPYSLDLSGSSIEELPSGLIVLGDLIIGNAKVTKLPGNAFIGGSLNAYLNPNFEIEEGAVIFGQVFGPEYSLPEKDLRNTVTPRIAVDETGHAVCYNNKITATQRQSHEGLPVDYMDLYVGVGNEDMVVYKNKWFYVKPKDQDLLLYAKLIEKRKQKERIGDKYKHLKMSDEFTLEEIFPIYQDITLACDKALKDFYPIVEAYGYEPDDKITLEVWIDGSKRARYKYNYLFTEYFEEEAN